MRLVVVSAWEPELAPLRARLEPLHGHGEGGGGQPLPLRAVGVGIVDAAVGTALFLAEARPDAVVFVGTCGALPGSGLAVGDVVCSARTRLAGPAVASAGVALLGPLAEDAVADAGLVAQAARCGARPVSVVTTLGITTTDQIARELSAWGEVEHLEAHAVARAAILAGVPFVCVLAVANPVGEGGRAAFREHHERASERAASVVFDAFVRT